MTQYQGLSTKEAKRRLVEYGENAIQSNKKLHPLRLFLSQFRDLLTLILLASTVLSVAMGEIAEALTIIAIVFLNALLGFFQELRTEHSLQKLTELCAPTALVMRDGAVKTLPARELVPGDYVLLKAGGRVPADCRILEQNALLCDESMLTGESVPVEKQACPQPEPLPPQATAFMGTLVTAGSGTAVVTATGIATEMGKIAGMLDAIEPEPTPLQKSLDQMGRYIAVGCLVICALVSGVGILRGEPVFDMVLTGISLSVAAIPEGLTAIVTIALALSVNRMVKQNAVIRKLHAVETLGCANVICSDKTGTLTENRMTVTTVVTWQHRFCVTGTGSAPGELLLEGRRAVPTGSAALDMLLNIALLCSNASIHKGHTRRRDDRSPYEVSGDPTESALVVLAAKAGRFRETCGWRVLQELPFDSTRKRMSVVAQSPSGQLHLLTKGGFDVILERCTHYLSASGVQPITPSVRTALTAQGEELASQALRVLGLCYRPLSCEDDTQENSMILVGFTGMIDPPRPDAREAVQRCRRAGIRPVMITGDSRITACAIAKQLHILTKGGEVLTGAQLDDMTDEQLRAALPHVSVFARVTPAHKLRIVQGLKQLGSVVAMTGDGVNDAPAVKEANIGVAMGRSGTDVVKEASCVILMDDRFSTLVTAVEEGRVIYRNIRKFIRYLLSCNIGEVVTMFLAMLMGMPVPLLPIHILLINLVTDGLPAIALGLEPADEDVMNAPPRRVGESIFAGGLLTTIVFRGCLIGLTTVAVFAAFLQRFGDLDLARTAALVTLALTQLVHVFECKSERKTLLQINPFNNLKLILAVAASAAVLFLAVYHPLGAALFCTVPLTLVQLGRIGWYLLLAPVLSMLLMGLGGRRRPDAAPTQKPCLLPTSPAPKKHGTI